MTKWNCKTVAMSAARIAFKLAANAEPINSISQQLFRVRSTESKRHHSQLARHTQKLTGHIASVGVPSKSTISSTWWSSDFPGISGRWASNSPRMHPAALFTPKPTTHYSMSVLVTRTEQSAEYLTLMRLDTWKLAFSEAPKQTSTDHTNTMVTSHAKHGKCQQISVVKCQKITT